MKRAPRKGESALYHVTNGTGDRQVFAISTDNYSPLAIEKTRLMESQALGGFRLKVEDCRCHFKVCRADGTTLTLNTLEWSDDSVTLHTAIEPALQPQEAAIVADLEQCAALMLATEVR